VIGVAFTPERLTKSRGLAEECGFGHVELREGRIDDLRQKPYEFSSDQARNSPARVLGQDHLAARGQAISRGRTRPTRRPAPPGRSRATQTPEAAVSAATRPMAALKSIASASRPAMSPPATYPMSRQKR
jgi:hypothetical protein